MQGAPTCHVEDGDQFDYIIIEVTCSFHLPILNLFGSQFRWLTLVVLEASQYLEDPAPPPPPRTTMVFPFTFSVPILYNPFTTLTTTYQRRLITTFSDDQQKKNACRVSDSQNQMSRGIVHAKSGVVNPQWDSSARVLPPPPPRAPSSATQLPPLPRSRKRSRGWEPVYSESVTVAPSMNVYSEGYIDTPRIDENLEGGCLCSRSTMCSVVGRVVLSPRFSGSLLHDYL